ncbi:MAG: hypothetical protein FWD33_00155 [Alphaproteobacteria bacterium]|nr:hypothetical protein [Alphaproteobacteria bacterium]
MTDAAKKFNYLADLHTANKPMVGAICATKGGLDRDNYVGRIFVNDLLELTIAFGEKIAGRNPDIKPRLEKLAKEFAKVSKDVTPSAKPIHKMTMDEFLKTIDMGEK